MAVSSGRISAFFFSLIYFFIILESGFLRGISLFFFLPGIIPHWAYNILALANRIRKSLWTDFLRVTAREVKFADITLYVSHPPFFSNPSYINLFSAGFQRAN